MRIQTLVENLVYGKGLRAEHGLSMYFEADGLKFLLDVGQSNIFAQNAERLSVLIEEIDFLIISHGHYDHTGGITEFLKLNSKAKIVVHRHAFGARYSKGRYVGMPSVKIPAERIIEADGCMQLSASVVVCCSVEQAYPIDTHKAGFSYDAGGTLVQDEFIDELFVCLLHKNACSILSSCSHNGITNFIEHVKQHFCLPIKSVIGGFHLKNASPEAVDHIIQFVNQEKVENIGFSHCSGIEHYVRFTNKCTAEVFYNATGTVLDL